MKAYQVVENGKPLEEKEMETPVPSGKEILLNLPGLLTFPAECGPGQDGRRLPSADC